MASEKSKAPVKKKRIAPQKEAPLPVVASLPEDIIAASFHDDHSNAPPSTAGGAQDGIFINIRQTPMVNIHSMLKERGWNWHEAPSKETEGSQNAGGGLRTQVDVVKRVLERQTRLFQVRDALSASESEISDSEEEESDVPSELEASDDDDSMSGGGGGGVGPSLSKEPIADSTIQAETEAGKGEEALEEALDEGQEEEWGLKNIGDYDLEDDFIDDSDVLHYLDNITKRTKFSGFYIHKGPLKMFDASPEQKPTRGHGKKPKGEARGKNDETQPTNTQPRQKTAANKTKKVLQKRPLPRVEKSDPTPEDPPVSATAAEK